MQTTDTIMMVRPFQFRRNEQTAVNNYFQQDANKGQRTNELAITEFDNFVKGLEALQVKVIVVQDEGKLDTPDSIFPNNVISFHGHQAILYPMFAENRRNERRLNYLGKLDQKGYHFDKLTDYTHFEDHNQFLEGTGSIVLDRENRIAYCSISDRANFQLFQQFCEDQGYEPCAFHAVQQVDGHAFPIYHTNVLMSIGSHFCVICWDTIKEEAERALIKSKLEATNKEIIPITEEQMNHFAGNILEIQNRDHEPIICMSTQAFEALTDVQKHQLEKYGCIFHAPLFTIEKLGGGSARCMMAEIFHA